jgi:riboflavin kinase / FMN adenylyltransferase
VTAVHGAVPSGTVVIGELDGLHVGHAALMNAARRVALQRGDELFAVVLHDERRPDALSPLPDRLAWAVERGAADAIALETSCGDASFQLHAGAARDAVAALRRWVQPTVVVSSCSPESSDGRSLPLIRHELHRRGMPVVEVQRSRIADEEVNSHRIRADLGRGDVHLAAPLLGRAYTLSGEVVHGAALGRTIGFPTANILPPSGMVIPADGVYAAHVAVDGLRAKAAVNVGRRPTVDGGGPLLLEAHLLDIDTDLYGKTMEIAFIRRLRCERRFDGLPDLTRQLHADVARVREILHG